MKRCCSMCSARGMRVAAEFVASDAGGLMWFECPDHKPDDNVGQLRRVSQLPIREFFERAGLPFDEMPELDEPAPDTERPPCA